MPELPEVETVCRGLRSQLLGDVVKSVEVLRSDSVGHPTPAEFAQILVGHKFVAVERRGKYILIELDQHAGLAVHLRMSGRLLLTARDASPGTFLRITMGLESGRHLRFEDMRVFGRIWYKEASQSFEEVIPGLASMGVEPLEGLTPELLLKLFRGKSQAIKTTLLDQRLIAGIGNIYADESLFQSRINPMIKSGDLTADECERLSVEIPKVLKKAIKNRGTTLRDYVDSEGVNGNYQNKSWVYGRDGEKCRVCKTVIERVKLAGRSTHFCPVCQPSKAARRKAAAKAQK